MTYAQTGWLIVLAGLPCASILLHAWWPTLSPLAAQTAWMQAGIVLCGLLGGVPRPKVWAWPWWVWGYTSLVLWWQWHTLMQTEQRYAAERLLPWLNVTTVVVALSLMQAHWDTACVARLWQWIAWSVVGVLGYCGLQLLHADPFFMHLDPTLRAHDQLVGTLGNPAHLGAFLACGWFVLWAHGWRWWPAMVACAVVLFLTHSTGGVAAWSVGVWWLLWRTARRWSWAWLGLVAAGVAWCAWQRSDWLNLSGRWAAWGAFYELWRTGSSLFGRGLGFVLEHSLTIARESGSPIWTWRHVHQEVLQWLLEAGVVGVGLVLAALVSWWRTSQAVSGRVVLAAQALVLAFLVNSQVHFAAHLWHVGYLALVAMATVLVQAQESAC